MSQTYLKIAFLIILILGTLTSSTYGSVGGTGHHWCYDNECGPSHWPGICHEGKAQSPINFLVKQLTNRTSYSVNMTADYCKPHDRFDIRNNGHSVEIHFKDQSHPELHTLSGEGFPDDYVFAQVHLHWGPTNDTGSEHAIEGRRYAMEMHLVHLEYDHVRKILYNDTSKDGFSVIGLLFEEDEKAKDNPFLTPIIKVLKWVNGTYAKRLVTVVDTKIDFIGLLPVNEMVFRYNGSLTTPPCSETVIWTVYQNPAKVSTRQMEIFRSLRMADGQPYKLNSRPSQELNERPVLHCPFNIRCPQGTRSNTSAKLHEEELEAARKSAKEVKQQPQGMVSVG